MTVVISRNLAAGEVPVHVFIVVVGEYVKYSDLPGAGAFADRIVRFWIDADRTFPDRQKLATIRVLASDPAGRFDVSTDRGGRVAVDRPTFDNCKTGFLAWSDAIEASRGVGFVHWVGHGRERVNGGNASVLLCDGAMRRKPREQSGMDWTRVEHFLNEKLSGLPVYCFLDTCRTPDKATIEYEGIGEADFATPENALVFKSTRRTSAAFWLDAPCPDAMRAGCGSGSIGTQAFLASLATFGARWDVAGQPHRILAREIVEASSGLSRRWAKHQAVDQTGTTGPEWVPPTTILVTDRPESIVDVRAPTGTPCRTCHARVPTSGSMQQSENPTSPFQFRLPRINHDFIVDGAVLKSDIQIVHPCMEL